MHPSADAAQAEPAVSGAGSAGDASVLAVVERAMGLHRGGHFAAARAAYEQALAQDPAQPDAWHLLGVLHAQQGAFDAAAAHVERAIALRPAEAMFHNNLGNVEIERGRLAEAEAHYRRAIELDPGRLDAVNNLGVLLGRRGDAAAAERLLRELVRVAPGFDDARVNLAQMLMKSGQVAEAVQACTEALVVAPRSRPLRRLLGAAYTLLGRPSEAERVYAAWLAAEPGDPVALHHWRACTGRDVPPRAADAYVQAVFDGFAASFDAKLAKLGYRAPEFCAQALAHAVGEPARALDILDAGCGTGLCAPLLAPWARRLVGVDLSAGMLARAALRGGYDELRQGELVACLQERAQAWGAVVSADTLCYFGDLAGLAHAAHAALVPGGWLVFTVEASPEADAEPFRLHAHGRYSHRLASVLAWLAEAGFEPPHAAHAVLRNEGDDAVAGHVVAARRPPVAG